MRTSFEALAKQRTLWNFLRVQSSFSQLPNEALALLASELERVEAPAGDVIVGEGQPSGPMYVIEAGRARVFKTDEHGERNVGYLRSGDFFGERSLLLDEPRAASVQAVTDCTLLVLAPDLFARLLAEFPAFEKTVKQLVEQYDYLRLAHVPLDFAEEILPAEAAASEAVSAEQAEELDDEAAAADAPAYEGEGRPAHRKRIRRFPHLYQLDEADCGAASLAMVCRYFGRAVAIAHVREAVHTATDGTSLAGITRGATELGLDARSVHASKSNLDTLPLPAIVHWEGNHWMVLYAVTSGHVRVSDPARGLRKIPRTEFVEKWSGYASLVTPTERLAEMPESKPSLRWLLPFVRPHKRKLVFAFLMSCVAAGLTLVLPILTQVVVDDVLPKSDLNLLYVVMAAIVAVLLAMTGATLIQRYLLSRVAVTFDVETLDFVTGKLLDLPMSYFNTRRTGDIERRLEGVRQVREFLVQSGVQVLTSATQLIAAVVLMAVYSWTLALVYLATVPLYALLMRYSAKRLRPMYDSLEEAYGRYQSAQIDAIRGIETVKALAAEEAFRGSMLRRFQTLADRVFRSQYLVMVYQGSLQLITFASFGLFLFVGSYEVIHGSLTLGQFVSFNSLIALANAPVLLLLLLWDQLQLAQILVGRIDDVIDQEPEQGADRSKLQRVTTLSGAVELRNLGFRYGGPQAPPILHGINLRIEPGEAVAIVGRSGSGKTTLIKLLAGLLEPTEGAIVYDGHELRTLDYRSLRRQAGSSFRRATCSTPRSGRTSPSARNSPTLNG